MKIDEVVQEVKSVSSKQLASLPDVKLKSFLRKAFGQILQELETTNEGLVKVSGLGSFRIKQVEVEKDNAKTLQKRIVFHPAKTKAKTPQ